MPTPVVRPTSGPSRLLPSGRTRGRSALRRYATLLVLLLAVAGCTYGKEEPGLFSRRDPEPTRSPAREDLLPPQPPERTNPTLPVAGERVWTSSEGLRVQTRIALHAVRRVEGATVLDWSVTPLSAPGMDWGDTLPGFVDLGLSDVSRANTTILLVDPVTAAVYRPLTHRSRREFNRCLCTPLWVAQLNLRIGETRLLQVTYPQLPANVGFVDVDMVTLPTFDHVPVTPIGQVPTVLVPTDLSRPAGPLPALRPALRFHNRAEQPQLMQSITVNRVVSGPQRTSVEWTLTSVTKQPTIGALAPEAPVAASLPDASTAEGGSVSGPRLRVTGSSNPLLPAQWMTGSATHQGRAECMCTPLGLWASSLRQSGGRATVTTNYPPLPPGVTSVDLVLPGAGEVSGLPVTPGVDSARLTGPPIAALSGRWTYWAKEPPRGWTTSAWPSPLPETNQLPQFLITVDRLLPGLPT